jgi:hypothetical protein
MPIVKVNLSRSVTSPRPSPQRAALQPQQLPDPTGRQVEQPVQHRPVERLALGGALHLDETIESGYLITAGDAELLHDTPLWIQK